jgi:nucleoside-diphosphate-sugar epimerase
LPIKNKVHLDRNSDFIIHIMPKILVIGATGHIGRALALSLLRSGNHVVYGLARTAAKAKELEALEVIPVLGSATDSGAYLSLIKESHIDVVVDAAGTYDGGFQILRDIRQAGEERLQHAQDIGVPLSGGRLGFVYTSGEWVHGPTRAGQAVNDLDPVAVVGAEAAPALVQWRTDLEKEVLAASDVLDVAIVRPGVVYGGSSWVFSSWFTALRDAATTASGQDDVTLPADGDALIGLLHVEDAGAGLHAAVDKLPELRGTGVWPVFDLTSSVENVGAILQHAARELGVKGRVQFSSTKDDRLAEAMSTSVLTHSGRARTILGWQPKRQGMLSQIGLYVMAWKAAQTS